MILIFKDNGNGIDIEKIRKRISDGENLNRDQLLEKIFDDKVSTADELSMNSGRGVGMSAVREQVLSIGGEIKIKTKMGEGTMFTIVIPYHKKDNNIGELNCKLVS